MMQKLLFIISLLGVVCAYDLLEDLKNCGVRSYYYYGPVSEYYLSCNFDDYRVKEVWSQNNDLHLFTRFILDQRCLQ